ncbi:ADP-ribosylglycohydrolase family protein [Novosphingobium tardum]|uniref:ADP-ribosylglycohydrolase family protein n=1 Tax=Novosphingobium tardum TaxID=1538021 RepID=A0ABV8RTS5_9SPHN
MTRTSLSHPLKIDTVAVGPGMGSIGITFCPGKTQPAALTGGWARDLGIDLDAIAAWGATAVVTLVEQHELDQLGVADLGAQVQARHMDWLHLPIPDVTAPGSGFERAWIELGAALRARLRSGFNVVVHCKGGLGRAGTVAARLMAELGHDPRSAIAAVRAARPGAIETSAQQAHVLAQSPVAEEAPATSSEAIGDRGLGAIVGMAIGDALGTTLEFKRRDSYPPLTDIVGGGPFGLEPGQWTDDTAMALALAESLIDYPGLDERDLMDRFVGWYAHGTYSCTGRCFDIGGTTSLALRAYQRTGRPVSGSTDRFAAGNGSLMRLAPVALASWDDRGRLADLAARQSQTTHAAPEAVSACVLYADILADAISGRPRTEVLRPRSEGAGAIRAIVKGSWRGKPRAQINSSGYVAHALEAALWSVARTSDFASAVLLAANLGDDADTTAAITGQLAGALYGYGAIPKRWLAILAWSDRIETAGRGLLERSHQ